ncbi:unnamed protein product [Caenorhabditis angaria]|uniref:Serpentine receptor class gamma n=1 Tax=Caenorhabditis angaria TaxID=860376 RepID=A0A9P1IEJ8_9PELO|nr:unnamed protein product [Caenorhabditis angaria]
MVLAHPPLPSKNGSFFIECDSSYDTFREVGKYVLQLMYLVPGIWLHSRILLSRFGIERDDFRNNSFGVIFMVNSVVSLLELLIHTFIYRPSIFIPPLCPIFTPILAYPSIIWKFIMILQNHLKAAKSMTQIFMSFNRMTCALWPIEYNSIWTNNRVKSVVFLIIVMPVGTTFNLILSRITLQPIYGGFITNYVRTISWASLPFQHLVFIITALSSTVICTSIAIYALLMLPNRVKGAERSLCIAAIIFSIGFIGAAGAQAAIAFCPLCLDSSYEVGKYVLQLLYLLPGILLHARILLSRFGIDRDDSRSNSFGVIFMVNSIVSILELLIHTFIYRPLIFIPPLCPIFTPILAYPSFIWKFIMVLQNHLKAAKSMTQIFMSSNRMTCALWPIKYDSIWTKNRVKLVVFLIIVLPVGATFNLIVSRITIQPIYGGFTNNYIRTIPWASLPFQHFIIIIIALSFTIICTSIAVYALLMLPNRVKGAERSLCIAAIIFSIGFIGAAGAQAAIVFCTSCFGDLLFMFHFWCIDFLDICQPVVTLFLSKEFRRNIFRSKVVVLQSGSNHLVVL